MVGAAVAAAVLVRLRVVRLRRVRPLAARLPLVAAVAVAAGVAMRRQAGRLPPLRPQRPQLRLQRPQPRLRQLPQDAERLRQRPLLSWPTRTS